MDINLTKIIDTAHKLKEAEHDANEELKIGNYRAGSTGLYIQETGFDGKPTGTPKLYGQCARKLLLRSKGIQIEEVSDDRRIMFSGGLMNEQILLEDIRLGSDYLLKQEEEIPTFWKTETLGTAVTGRPDIVLCDPKTEESVLGLELKMVSSLWTARDVGCKQKPKFNHLCQAAHYMWQLDIPFKLVYTSYVDYQIPSWASGPSHFPAPDTPGSEIIEYAAPDKRGLIKAKKTLPFRKVYDLRWSNNGTLLYRMEGDLTFNRTIITLDGIKSYFELLDRAQEQKELPPRPENVDIDGVKSGWSMCDPKYCSLASVCDKVSTLGEFLSETTNTKGDS